MPEAATPTAPAQTQAPTKTIGGGFFDKLTAPPAAHELLPGAKPPGATPEPPPNVDPVAPPASTSTPEPKPAEKPEEPELEVPARVTPPAKKEEPAKPAATGEATKTDEVDEYLKLTEEEQEAKLSKLSKTDAHKLARKAFSRAGRMLQEKDTLEKKLKDAEKSAQKVTELEKKVLDLQEAPETKANLAKLEKAQADLTAAQEKFAADQERVEKDKKYVEGLQFAHDVKKTPRWKEYVSVPSEELINDIKMLAASVGEDEATRVQVANSIIFALNQPDEAERWRALKEAGKALDPADATLLGEIFKGHQRIEKNKAFLQGQSEEARAALDAGREKEEKEKKDARTKEFKEGAALSREKFIQELPWVDENFDISKYPEAFQKTINDTRAFAKQIMETDLTPGQEAKVKQGFAYFQGASILARNYSKVLEAENTQLREELKKFQDKEAAAAAELAEKEKNKGELTPSAAPKKVPVATKPAAPVQSGPVRSVGASFAALVAKGT